MFKVGVAATAAAVVLTAAPDTGAAQTIRSITSTRARHGEPDLTVNVRFGMAVLTMGRESSTQLYRAHLAFDEDLFLPVTDYAAPTRTLDLGIRARHDDLRHVDGENQRLDLTVSPEVPVILNLEFGAGKAQLDLGGLRVISADVSTGASETHIDFSRPTLRPCDQLRIRVGAAALTASGLGNANCASLDVKGAAGSVTLDFSGEWQSARMTGEVTLGLGGLVLRLPRNVGVSIRLKRFLAPFESDAFHREGDRYVTANYESAAAVIDLRIEAVLGDVDVEWIN